MNIAHNKVGGLSANARKLGQLLNGVGDNPVQVVVKGVGHLNYALCLGLVQSAGTYYLRHIVNTCVRKAFQGGICGEKLLCNDIHTGVGALGGQSACYHQLVRLLVCK